MAISIPTYSRYSNPEGYTIRPPYIPELNEFFARMTQYFWEMARSKPRAIDIIRDVSANELTLHAIPNLLLIQEIWI
jgi:hypothetical protein